MLKCFHSLLNNEVFRSVCEIMSKLKFAIPIGTLQQSTLDMLNRAGFQITLESRSYRPTLENDSELFDNEIFIFINVLFLQI